MEGLVYKAQVKRKIASVLILFLLFFTVSNVFYRSTSHASTTAISNVLNKSIIDWKLDEAAGYIYAITSDTNELLFIRTNDLQIVKQLAIGSSPSGIAMDNGKLYIPLSGATQIKVVDIASQAVSSTINTAGGRSPFRLAVDGNKLYYVVKDNSSFIYDINLTSNQETQVDVYPNDYYMADLVVDTTTHTLYVGESGLSGTDLAAYSTQTDTLVPNNQSTYYEGYGFSYPNRKVILDGDDVFFAGHKLDKNNLKIIHGDYKDGYYENKLHHVKGSYVFSDSAVYDRDNFTKITNLPYTTERILMDSTDAVYLFNTSTKTVDKVSLNLTPTNTITQATYSDNKLSFTVPLTDMVFSQETGLVYAVSQDTNKLLYINPATLSIEHEMFIGSKPTDIDIFNGKLYVALFGSTKIAVTDAQFSGTITTFIVNEPPFQIAISSDTIYYLPEYGGSGHRNLYTYDVASGVSKKVVFSDQINTSFYRGDLIYSPELNKLYIGESQSSPSYLSLVGPDPANVGKYKTYDKSNGYSPSSRPLVKDEAEIFFAGKRLDASNLMSINASYGEQVIFARNQYVFSKKAVYDRTNGNKLFDLPFTIDHVTMADDGSVVLYSLAKNGIYRYTSVEEIKIPREVPKSSSFTDTNYTSGQIQGSLKWAAPDDQSYITSYTAYYLDAQGNKLGMIGELAKGGANAISLASTAIPTNAKQMGVFSKNAYAESVKYTASPIYDSPNFLAGKLSFTESNTSSGLYNGSLQWSPGDETGITGYAVYFLDANLQAVGNAITKVNAGTVTYGVYNIQTVPSNAVNIGVVALNHLQQELNMISLINVWDNISAVPVTVANSVYLPVPGAISFICTETVTGKVGGTLSWKAADNQSQLTGYKVFFLDANNDKVGNLALVKKTTGSSYRITIPNGTVLPSGAVKIAIAALNAFGESSNLSILENIESTGTPDEGTDPVQVPDPNPNPNPNPEPSPNPGSGSVPVSDSTAPKVEISTNDKGQIVVKLTFTNEQLAELIAKQLLSQVDSLIKSVVIKIQGQGDFAQTELSASAITQADSENAETMIHVQSSIGEVKFNADSIKQAVEQQGLAVDTTKITVTFSKIDAELEKSFGILLQQSSAEQVLKPIDFTIQAASGDKQIEITSVNSYIQHSLLVPGMTNITASKNLVGVVFDPITNSYYPVPTFFTVSEDGTLQANMMRKGNSIYSLVKNVKTFEDVPSSHFAKEAIETLASKFIISGYDNGSFGYDRPVTRAEFAALLIRGLGIQPKSGLPAKFNDVQTNAWYAAPVYAAVEVGLVSGYEDGTFKPDQPITRQEMMKMVHSMLQAGGYTKQLTETEKNAAINKFGDQLSIQPWAREAVAVGIQEGIVNGVTDSTFSPATLADRGQSAKILYQALKVLNFIN
ncbi:S-layer homology domain-containing protein [Paenibacillus sp. V4I5]|uniref:S-layer homology domain-containing protein n=1 Tax=Paenibacillus sp. V4I5 TaxID=3042306 RepID=UPI00279054C1|nr:S-layer homology domain-containing protein [Paenibacillus sp. V4I5]MDQ0918976.1 hypothetical protein [Paenibacillus sp. V4I5]